MQPFIYHAGIDYTIAVKLCYDKYRRIFCNFFETWGVLLSEEA